MSKIIAIGYKNAAAVYVHLLNWNKTTQPITIAMREAIHCPVWGKDRRSGGGDEHSSDHERHNSTSTSDYSFRGCYL